MLPRKYNGSDLLNGQVSANQVVLDIPNGFPLPDQIFNGKLQKRKRTYLRRFHHHHHHHRHRHLHHQESTLMVICIITVMASSIMSVLNMTFRFTDGLNPQVVMENNPQARHVPPSIWSHIVQPIHFSLDAIFLLCRHDPFPRCNGTPQYKHTPQTLVFGRSLQTGRQTTSQVIFAPRQRVHFFNHQRRLTFIPRLLQDN